MNCYCLGLESDFIRSLHTAYLSVFSPNVGKCGKNVDQNNSEYGLFLRSDSAVANLLRLEISVCCF